MNGIVMSRLLLTKAQKLKIVFYAILILGTCTFGLLFKANYDKYIFHSPDNQIDIEENINSETKVNATVGQVNISSLFIYGALFLLFGIALGLTVGRQLSALFADKLVDTLHGSPDLQKFINKVDYEKAEEEWTKGNFLEAIEIFRAYLKENPTEIHASIRIAEIYEKDVHNYLAAALEYEEVLKYNLPDEQWGWTAIHLCNLYISKLNRPNDAIHLMKKIARDYEFTAAAEKARQHLDRMGIKYEEPQAAPEGTELEQEDTHKTSHIPASEQFKRKR